MARQVGTFFPPHAVASGEHILPTYSGGNSLRELNVHTFLRSPVLGLVFLEIQTVLSVLGFPARPYAIMFKVE